MLRYCFCCFQARKKCSEKWNTPPLHLHNSNNAALTTQNIPTTSEATFNENPPLPFRHPNLHPPAPFPSSSLYSSLASIPAPSTASISLPSSTTSLHSDPMHPHHPHPHSPPSSHSSASTRDSTSHIEVLPYHPYQLYHQGKKLGSGGFAHVYIVEHKHTHQKGAMKMIRKQLMVGSEIYLRREIQILKTLSSHPNVAGLVAQDALFETQDAFYLILELCEGGELFTSIVEDGWYDESDAIHHVHQILCAVEYCHSHNVVHRDLKPENILLKEKKKPRKENTLMIADFGLSNFIQMEGELLNTQCGTQAYISPEVIKRSGYGKPCDMWSIGCITYVLLCGYLPFDDDSVDAILTASFEFHPEEWSSISAQAKDFICKLLVVNPDDRMTAQQALCHPWLQQASPEDSSSKVNLVGTLKRGSELSRFKKAVKQAIQLNRLGLLDRVLHPNIGTLPSV